MSSLLSPDFETQGGDCYFNFRTCSSHDYEPAGVVAFHIGDILRFRRSGLQTFGAYDGFRPELQLTLALPEGVTLTQTPLPASWPSLKTIARAVTEQFPAHLARHPQLQHQILAPAYVNGEPRLFATIFAMGTRLPHGEVLNITAPNCANRPPTLFITGSGLATLVKNQVRSAPVSGLQFVKGSCGPWLRDILRMVKAVDRRVLRPEAVADRLAALNLDASGRDASVSPNCIVAWRGRRGGGAHRYYDGVTANADAPSLPSIVNGGNFEALLNVIQPHLDLQLNALMAGSAHKIDEIAINRELSRLPNSPDEKLR
jgi:hypothetical protein